MRCSPCRVRRRFDPVRGANAALRRALWPHARVSNARTSKPIARNLSRRINALHIRARSDHAGGTCKWRRALCRFRRRAALRRALRLTPSRARRPLPVHAQRQQFAPHVGALRCAFFGTANEADPALQPGLAQCRKTVSKVARRGAEKSRRAARATRESMLAGRIQNALFISPDGRWRASSRKKVNDSSRASCALTRFSCTLRD